MTDSLGDRLKASKNSETAAIRLRHATANANMKMPTSVSYRDFSIERLKYL